jgi:hypothetical protein
MKRHVFRSSLSIGIFGTGFLVAVALATGWRMSSAETAAPCGGPPCVCGQQSPAGPPASAGRREGRRPGAGGGPAAQLDRLDERKPVPLMPMMAHHQKQNMRDHLLVIQEIALALAQEDFTAVETASRRIGYSDAMATMCSHMGAGAPGFTDMALSFHRTADGIGAAARNRDRAGVLKAVGETLQVCTGCHATFKQQIVSGPGPGGHGRGRGAGPPAQQ